MFDSIAIFPPLGEIDGAILYKDSDIYIKEAMEFGIPKKDLFTTYPVSNTIQEAKAIRKIFENHINLHEKWARIIRE